MSLLLGILTFVLVLISIFMVLVILAQRAKSDGGVGAALGGGMTEAAFGGESGNVLSRATEWSAAAFFVLAFVIYLGHIYQHKQALEEVPAALPASPDLLPAAPAPDSNTSATDLPVIPEASSSATDSATPPSAESGEATPAGPEAAAPAPESPMETPAAAPAETPAAGSSSTPAAETTPAPADNPAP